MTDDELKAIEARANAATPGPWPLAKNGRLVLTEAADGKSWQMVAESGMPENAEFIAHAREDIPKLIAEVRTQRKDVSKMGERIARMEREMRVIAEAPEHMDVRRVAGEVLGWTYTDDLRGPKRP